jgi:hypothetical protein
MAVAVRPRRILTLLLGAGQRTLRGGHVDESRIRFISHEGKKILLVDLSNCSAAELERLVPEYVTPEPKSSVLLLADFTGAEFDHDAAMRLKESTVFDRPHLKKSAWVGVDSMPRVFYQNIKSFSQRELPTFKTRDEAMDWLVKD